MSSLVKNELTKIFKKKSIYIALIIALVFVILTNCIDKFFRNSNYYSINYRAQLVYLNQELENLDPNKETDISMYIDIKSQIEICEMMEKYKDEQWKEQIINSRLIDEVREKNTYLYGFEKDNEKVKQKEQEIAKISERIEADDWMYFAKLDLEDATKNLESLEQSKKTEKDKQYLSQVDFSIEEAKVRKEVAQYRVDKKIKYGNDYLNEALNDYKNACISINQMEDKEEKDFKEQKQYNEYLEQREVSKYMIENGVNVGDTSDLRGLLKNLFEQYGLFILVIIIMVAGSIVSEEFNKGTIKLLLIKPYSRSKILLSKFIAVLVITIFAIASVILMQLVVGVLLFGIDSLQVPVVMYNFTTGSLETMNIFAYLGIQILTQLPIMILLATLAFAFSTIFTNSAVSIALPLLGFMVSSIINTMAIAYNVEFMKFFVTLNWDFNEYLFGRLPSMEGLNVVFSAVICISYFVIMMGPTFAIFKKKNIKNI